MPRQPLYRAVTTKASITSLYAMAEADGSCHIRLDSEHACRLVRNKLYAHRSQIRKTNEAVTGLGISQLDGFKFNWSQAPDGKWDFIISYNDIVEFELIVPDNHKGPIPHFDTLADDVPRADPEAEFESSFNEYYDTQGYYGESLD